MNKGDAISGWIEVKVSWNEVNGFDKLNLLTVFSKLCNLSMQGCIVGEDCLKLIAQIVAVSPQNMFVESAISAYDLIKSDDRSSLKRETLNDYMTIKLNMPPVTSIDLHPVVVAFLKDKDRRPQKNLT